MSRIGKSPVAIAPKVEVKVVGQEVTVKGPKGTLAYVFTKLVKIEVAGGAVTVTPVDDGIKARSLWGTTRTLIDNMVQGVTKGFSKTLEFTGVGYKAAVSGETLTLNLGHSHPIEYKLPKGIEAKVQKNAIEVTGCDKELVGFVSAKIRSFRGPEPYKGKGIKYQDEVIIRKAGKTSAKK